MKKTQKNEIASAILNANLPNRFENKYLQKTKALSNSKSAVSISALSIVENAFKKSSKKLEPQYSQNTKRTQHDQAKQTSLNYKLSNNSEKPEVYELNKFINNNNAHGVHNPQQFFVRNQLFEKQKQLKLQFQRRKKLYGIASDAKMKPNLLLKDNQDNKNQDATQNQEKSKTYKDMYYKKYGKFKMDVDISKKKTKNYEELMKESIARFQQKFKDLDGESPNVSHNNNQQNHQNQLSQVVFPLKKKGTHIIQSNSSGKVSKNVPEISEVDNKIKQLMQKLHFQEELNDQMESFSELSRIDTQSEAKGQQINTSNLFHKIENQINFKEEQASCEIASKDNQKYLTQQYIDLPHQQAKIPFISSLSLIINETTAPLHELAEIKQQKCQADDIFQTKQQSIKKHLQQEQIQQQRQFAMMKQLPNHQQQGQMQIPVKLQVNDFKVECELKASKQASYQISNDDEQNLVKILDYTKINQEVTQIHTLQIFLFKQISHPRSLHSVLNFEQIKILSQSIKIEQNNKHPEKQGPQIVKQLGIKHQQITQVQQVSQQKQISQSNAQKIQNMVKEFAQKAEGDVEFQQESSIDYECQTQIQSFVDYNGTLHQNVLVEVQNFGFCRFLVIDEESERLSQDSY